MSFVLKSPLWHILNDAMNGWNKEGIKHEMGYIVHLSSDWYRSRKLSEIHVDF